MTKVGEGLPRAALIARRDKSTPLVIQLARYCPMILDRPPIHRFNAGRARAPGHVPPLAPLRRVSLPPGSVKVVTGYDDK